MSESQNERRIMHHVEKLVAEEHRPLGKGGLDEHEKAALGGAKVELDQCRDLLRHRRAKREFGDKSAEASVRPVSVVEKYEG